jgi:C_GCAxxG_C_C family probable redox protein
MPIPPEVTAALETYEQGFNCAQAVLAAFAPRHGLSPELALKLAAPFGTGKTRAATCGAVSAALMVIGLAHGRSRPDDMQARARTHALSQAFQDRFEKLHGSCTCEELLGLDPTTPEGRQAAVDRGLFESRCTQYVRSSVLLILDLVYGEPAR